MPDTTLNKILEQTIKTHEQSDSMRTEIDVTLDVMKELFLLDKNNHLPPELKIFIRGENALMHMNNIISEIIIIGKDIPQAIAEEIKKMSKSTQVLSTNVNSDDLKLTMYETKEQLAQLFFRRTGQVHAHINSIESYIKQYIDEVENDSILNYVKENMESIKMILSTIEDMSPTINSIFESTNRIDNSVEKINKTIIKSSVNISSVNSMVETLVNDGEANQTNLETMFNMLLEIKEGVDEMKDERKKSFLKNTGSKINMDAITSNNRSVKSNNSRTQRPKQSIIIEDDNDRFI